MLLETKTSYVVGFWRPKQEPDDLDAKYKALLKWLEEHAETYAVVVHDLDIDAQGERVTTHIHFVYKATECRRLSTNLNEIATAIDVDPLSVSVDKASSVKASIRYLIHKDDPQKHQYAMGAIQHNWPTEEFEKLFADKARTEIDFDFLLDLIRRSRTITDVIAVVGLGSYRYWRPVIADMWKDAHRD